MMWKMYMMEKGMKISETHEKDRENVGNRNYLPSEIEVIFFSLKIYETSKENLPKRRHRLSLHLHHPNSRRVIVFNYH